MESDGDDLIYSDSLFHDKGPAMVKAHSATLSDIQGQLVVDMNQIANEIYVQLELIDG